MTSLITYYHGLGTINISFHLDGDEEAFGFNVGESEVAAGNQNKFHGWFDKESELLGKRYKCDKNFPFICLFKKRAGFVIRTEQCINILKDYPAAAINEITVRTWTF